MDGPTNGPTNLLIESLTHNKACILNNLYTYNLYLESTFLSNCDVGAKQAADQRRAANAAEMEAANALHRDPRDDLSSAELQHEVFEQTGRSKKQGRHPANN